MRETFILLGHALNVLLYRLLYFVVITIPAFSIRNVDPCPVPVVASNKTDTLARMKRNFIQLSVNGVLLFSFVESQFLILDCFCGTIASDSWMIDNKLVVLVLFVESPLNALPLRVVVIEISQKTNRHFGTRRPTGFYIDRAAYAQCGVRRFRLSSK